MCVGVGTIKEENGLRSIAITFQLMQAMPENPSHVCDLLRSKGPGGLGGGDRIIINKNTYIS